MVRRTPSFTATSMPPTLRRSHLTSVWAELVVEEGSVLYTDETPRRATVRNDSRIAIAPGVAHHIEPADDALFHIQFYG
ncbi:MAG: DUF1971 domain-containing protein [Acidimicrobiaceae bacterium]|nr:DUF1971 domain-containing protein [Acidimicrobiaceae bacterium]